MIQIFDIYSLSIPNSNPLKLHTQVAVISDNHLGSHTHDMSWLNRVTAPIPIQLEKKIRSKVMDNPNLSTFQTTIKRYMTNKHGLRQDIKRDLDFDPNIQDPCIYITDRNRLAYQFYKAVREIHGLNANDQDRLTKYVQNLKTNDEIYDSSDLLFYYRIKK